jgi:hypothetical protein
LQSCSFPGRLPQLATQFSHLGKRTAVLQRDGGAAQVIGQKIVEPVLGRIGFAEMMIRTLAKK